MSYGVTTNTSFVLPTKHPTSRKPNPTTTTITTLKKFPRFRCSSSSSSFKTRASVEESGIVAERGESFYELLGISEGGSFDEIKRAYKQLARKYHPDVSPPNRTEEHTRRFIEVQEAYETLSDPRLRAIYDRDLARGLHLAFSSRKRFDEEMEERSQWKRRWQDQVAELQRRSFSKDSVGNLSWELGCAAKELHHLQDTRFIHSFRPSA